MSVFGKFGDISGLKLNKKKIEALWIGSLKKNKTKRLKINVFIDPIKIKERTFHTTAIKKKQKQKQKKQ